MSLTEIAEAVNRKRREWLQSESNDSFCASSFRCAIYVSEDHWRDQMRAVSAMRGEVADLPWLFYNEQKILGFPVYAVRGKDHPPFYICVTS